MGNADNDGYPPMESVVDRCNHGVAIPPPQPFFKSLRNSLKETFFPDDPLRQFKGQPRSRRLVLGLQYVLPILEWGPRYTLEFLRADLVAGITIASLAIPQGISYAKLANLPPILGLCECFSTSEFSVSGASHEKKQFSRSSFVMEMISLIPTYPLRECYLQCQGSGK